MIKSKLDENKGGDCTFFLEHKIKGISGGSLTIRSVYSATVQLTQKSYLTLKAKILINGPDSNIIIYFQLKKLLIRP